MIGTGAAHLTLFIPSLSGGGAEMSMLRIAGGLVERDHKVDLVLCRARGPLADQVPVGVRVIELQATFSFSARLHALAADAAALALLTRPVIFARKLPPRMQFLPDLARYLRARRPDALLAALTTANWGPQPAVDTSLSEMRPMHDGALRPRGVGLDAAQPA